MFVVLIGDDLTLDFDKCQFDRFSILRANYTEQLLNTTCELIFIYLSF